ncbi:hypothetical protein G3H63_09215 [Microbacterium resistens]|uniref:hypothetical protein n=1 Tax=Microbacterium resistens TaxID=156977 RepID=UPI001C561622|nr:hypothetical protein [Microbacterium resistens]MBW1639249.1 hypothetical protein [Microbacterium resistens]
MPNAAHELADLLESWRVVKNNSTIRSTRGLTADDVEGWRNQARAFGLLHQIDQYLAAAELAGSDIDHFVRAYPDWAKGIVAPEYKWNEAIQATRTVIEQHRIDLLRALGDIMKGTEISVAMTPETSQAGRDAVDALMDELKDPTVQLRDAERRYVYELIASVRRVFEESKVLGSVNLMARVHELLGVMTMLAETLSESDDTKQAATRILRAARRIVPYAKFGARVSAGAIGVAADLVQITSGS